MACNYDRKFNNFLNNNPDLVEQYEANSDNVPLESCKDDIVEAYKNLQKANKNLDFNRFMKDCFNVALTNECTIIEAFDQVRELAKEFSTQNSLQFYFKEVGEVYGRNDNKLDYEYTPENRDKLIEMNLKSVIAQARKYQGLGLTLQELISAGNLGLCIAWDKFDPSRAKLKDNIMELVQQLPDTFKGKVFHELVTPFLRYGDVNKKIMDRFPEKTVTTKAEVIKWVDNNIYNAKFSSIATMWIRAYILIEIDNYSRIVKKPKSEIYKDRLKSGAYQKEVTLDIDAPVSEDGTTVLGDLLNMESADPTDLEVAEAYDTFKLSLQKLLDGVKSRDRSIFLRKFGIGLPRPMLPKEIAELENLSIARVSQICLGVVDQMQKNAIKYNIDPNILFDAVKKFL